ncbi:MAG: Endonuclease related to archaeal Holliday junction resolvase [Methanoregulaceae archaeon PtaB.Bin152]|nr:MAG: Endonuclease related to archaeal Holliday junction resolvase [Methanoregulaceae archaeon PtaB.Bin152]
MIEWALLLLVIGTILLAWRYLALRMTLDRRAACLFEEWRSQKMEDEVRERAELLHREWTLREEARVRRDAIEMSGAVIRGKVTEHLIPYFPGFSYDPRDARFLGTPVDLIVFEGLSAGSLERITFLEVKTGKTGALSQRERQVRECVERGLVRYEVHSLRRDS